MITFLILIFAALHSPLTWGSAFLPFFAYGVGIVVVGFIGYKVLRNQLPTTPLDLPLLLFVLVALISSQWFSIWRVGSQVRVLTLIGYVAAFCFVYSYVSEEKLTGSVIIAGWVIIAGIIAISLCHLRTPTAELHDLGNANVLASILLLHLPFGARIEDKRTRGAWFVLGAVAMLATRSRGGLLGLAMALGVLWGIDKRLIVGASAAALPALIMWKRTSAIIRLRYWEAALQAFLSSPWFGIGPANCYQWITLRVGEVCPHAHNIFLTIAAEMGIVGLIVFGLLLWQIWKHRRSGPAWAALAGFMVHSFVDDPVWFWAPGLGVMSLLAIMLKGGQNDGE